jgi:hypothetical protein
LGVGDQQVPEVLVGDLHAREWSIVSTTKSTRRSTPCPCSLSISSMMVPTNTDTGFEPDRDQLNRPNRADVYSGVHHVLVSAGKAVKVGMTINRPAARNGPTGVDRTIMAIGHRLATRRLRRRGAEPTATATS